VRSCARERSHFTGGTNGYLQKLALAVLIASTAALGLNTTSARAASVPGCFPGPFPCSDSFYLNGGSLGSVAETGLGEGEVQLILGGSFSGITLDTTVALIFTEQGTGISSTAPVSDIVLALNATTLDAQSDPFEIDVAGIIAAEGILDPSITNFIVLEETGSPQSLTAFNSNLTSLQFASDVGDPPAVPLPAALPLFATGLGGLGLLG
jgi:hypothetical protein